MTNLAPIVLFVYNRPKHTQRTIDALAKNGLAKESVLFVFTDGPKNPNASEQVDAVRKILKTLNGFKSIEIIEREKNFGLAANIINGVSKVVEEYGSVIVLEDDIVTTPFFLSFMNKALNFYKNEKKVWHISGWNYPIDSEKLGDTFLWRGMNCWGWATWSDRWENFERKPEKLIHNWSAKKIRKFNLDGAFNFWNQVKSNYNKRYITWAIFWHVTIFENNGLCLNPSESLVYNSGFDGSGEHCTSMDTFDSELSKNNNWDFNGSLLESKIAVSRIKSFYKGMRTPISHRIMRRLYNVARKVKSIIISRFLKKLSR